MSPCEDVRASLSAVLDGERPPLDPAAVEGHLAGCSSCRRFADRLPELARRTRLTDPGTVPDLRAGILAALAREREARGRVTTRAGLRPDHQRRLVASLAGIAQLAVAVPTLVGAGDVGHLAHDLAAFEIALAGVFLLAAWQPARAGALVLVAATFAAVGVLAAVRAVLDGAALAGEVAHVVPVVGAAVVWSIAARGQRPDGGSGTPTAAG